MKQTKVILSLLLAVVLTFSLAACGKSGDVTSIFEDLLAKDYEVYYTFYSRGLPLDDTTPPVRGSYLPVNSKEYKKLSDLKKQLQGTYHDEGIIQRYLNLSDGSGHDLFTDIDGKLHQSTLGDMQMLRFEEVEGTLTLVEESKNYATFTFQEQSLDGSLYQCNMSMTHTSKGWRLDAPRKDAARTLVREGSDEDTLPKTASVRDVADDFLAALKNGDTAALEKLSNAPEGIYNGWSAISVTEASITQALEEADSYGRYLIDLNVSNGAGILPDGQTSFIMEVGFYDYSEFVSVYYFKPAEPMPYSRLPYEERTDPACESVMQFINFFGLIEFQSTADLPSEVIAEYCLADLVSDMSFEEAMEGVSPKKLAEKAEKLFGIQDFSAVDTAFYNADTNTYMTIGRGGYQVNYLLWGSTPQEDDTVTISVSAYSDPLQYQKERTFTYALQTNSDDSVQFISAVRS